MPVWMLTLIAVLGYVTGFIASGALYSHLWTGAWARSDLTTAMALWPIVLPLWGVYTIVARYVRFLEGIRDRKIGKINANVTSLWGNEKAVTQSTNRWEE